MTRMICGVGKVRRVWEEMWGRGLVGWKGILGEDEGGIELGCR